MSGNLVVTRVEPDDFYHDASRRLQRHFGTERLAAHIARRYVLDRLDNTHIAWIRQADAVYVATIDSQGHPECSYKGGLPGFVGVRSARTLEIPSYDGNGMYRTLGNAAAEPWVGLLFLFPDVPAKLRVNGACSVLTDPDALCAHSGAEAVLRVSIREVFENCPRYLHDRVAGGYSEHCPRPGYRPPDPAWKLKPEYDGLLPDSKS
jgi:predicted pyridoxine 5'-phosphate oxidase superfamily flavin-nucleotide-binding protein